MEYVGRHWQYVDPKITQGPRSFKVQTPRKFDHAVAVEIRNAREGRLIR